MPDPSTPVLRDVLPLLYALALRFEADGSPPATEAVPVRRCVCWGVCGGGVGRSPSKRCERQGWGVRKHRCAEGGAVSIAGVES